MRRWKLAAAGTMAALLAAGCSSSASGSGSGGGGSGPVTITIWHNYGTEQNATALKNLATAFEKLHPNIKINVVSQDASNYFAQLQSAAISKNGPDLAVMWTGLFTLQYKSFLTNLKTELPASALARIDPNALKWSSDGFNPNNASYVIPLENQFYIGFYNKADFAKAGVTSVPTDWSQLYAACTKLKKAGFTPIVYGNGGQPLGATFYPWYDMSYMMIGAHSLAQWKGLYDGSIKWTAQSNLAQLKRWHSLYTSGCTNKDVLTKTNNMQDFEKGKAAMMVDGTWDTAQYTSTMKSNVAAFVPPFSTTPIKGVVEYPGDGFSVMKYSQHQKEAFKFLDFMTTRAAGNIINAAGLIPDIAGMSTSNPVNQQMLNFVNVQHMTPYPMLDNYIQVNVVNAGSKVLPAVLAGQQSALSAMKNMAQAWQQLPANQRSSKSFNG